MDSFKCPLTDDFISGGDCCIIQTAAETLAPDIYLPHKQDVEVERKICLECKHHEKL